MKVIQFQFPINAHLTRLFFSILSILIGFSADAQQRIRLDENWKFHFGHAADPKQDFNYGITTIFSKSGGAYGTAIDPSFNDSSWRTLQLPHDWAVELPFVQSDNFDVQSHGYKPVGGLYPATSIGWYRKHFNVASADSNQRFQVQFDGIFRNAQIWVNGLYVGNNQSGYVGVSYDITDFLRYGKENVLVVRVDATQYEGWFYEGAGIYRHVWLQHQNKVHIATDGLFAHAAVTGNKATVTVETTVAQQQVNRIGATVSTYITDRTGKIVARSAGKSLVLNGYSEGNTVHQLTLNNPRLWNLDDPYLYRVISVVQVNGITVDTLMRRIGIRTIQMDANKGFFLNGKHLKIQGVNNHQDHAGVGAALPDYLQYYRIRLLKEMGANAYRTSHNAPTTELLDACDSLGMLVLDEQRLLNSSTEYMDQFERLIKRDRNHPSVFLWSIGNEEGWIHTTETGKRIAQSLLAKQQQLDPTRTSTYAADLPNVWNGVNEVIPVRGFNYRHFAVADYHKDHPDQPLLGTEMGSTVTTRGIYQIDSIRAYVPDQDITAPWWASKAEDWWKLAAVNPYWMGGFVWTGFDYRGEPTPFQWPNVNSHFGIMDVCGFPKNIYYYYQSWWTNKDVLHISPHWNWRNKRGMPVEVWVNSNADSVELFLNNKSLGTQVMPRNGHLNWTVKYEPGKLLAVATKQGRKFSTAVETTGTPAEVVITPYKTTLLADGMDATVINVSIIDKEGREVPDADNLVRFELEGDGKIIGVGNGDPSSHEPDQCATGAWQRSAFNGKCQVIVQAGKHPDLIHFKATAAGLWDGATDIISVSPASVAVVTHDNQYTLRGAAALSRSAGKVIGADISFLPELEAKGIQFTDQGKSADAIALLKQHGFNYIRLRVFNDPATDSGYSPGKGFCDLPHTIAMAKRVKAAGLKLLLDFHYSDYWADPGKQYKPASWKGLSFTELQKALYQYTVDVMKALQAAGCTPDMVQIGNEINHGIVWPEGNVAHLDSLAQLLKAGTAAVKSVDPTVVMLLHVALGGQNDESVFFIDNMLARGVHFDVIGESYYPKWHGTLDDLQHNLENLVQRYGKEVMVTEYSQEKIAVNKIVFNLPQQKGVGTFIWEPLNTWESIFDYTGKANAYLNLYDLFQQQYLLKK